MSEGTEAPKMPAGFYGRMVFVLWVALGSFGLALLGSQGTGCGVLLGLGLAGWVVMDLLDGARGFAAGIKESRQRTRQIVADNRARKLSANEPVQRDLAAIESEAAAGPADRSAPATETRPMKAARPAKLPPPPQPAQTPEKFRRRSGEAHG